MNSDGKRSLNTSAGRLGSRSSASVSNKLWRYLGKPLELNPAEPRSKSMIWLMLLRSLKYVDMVSLYKLSASSSGISICGLKYNPVIGTAFWLAIFDFS